MNRLKFIGGITSAAVGLTIVPAHILGGKNHIAPSDKINLAYIELGTQGRLGNYGFIKNPWSSRLQLYVIHKERTLVILTGVQKNCLIACEKPLVIQIG